MSFVATLRQSTAVNVIIGPFVDSLDGNTEEVALTIAQADVRLSKNAGADAQKNNATTCAHEGNGMYMCELDATDTNTVGTLCLWVHVAGARFVRHDFQVVEEAAYDAIYATSAAPATAAGVSAVATQASVDAVKAKTDQLTFTVANYADVNVLKVNGVTIVGNGSATPFNV